MGKKRATKPTSKILRALGVPPEVLRRELTGMKPGRRIAEAISEADTLTREERRKQDLEWLELLSTAIFGQSCLIAASATVEAQKPKSNMDLLMDAKLLSEKAIDALSKIQALRTAYEKGEGDEVVRPLVDAAEAATGSFYCLSQESTFATLGQKRAGEQSKLPEGVCIGIRQVLASRSSATAKEVFSAFPDPLDGGDEGFTARDSEERCYIVWRDGEDCLHQFRCGKGNLPEDCARECTDSCESYYNRRVPFSTFENLVSQEKGKIRKSQ